MALKIVGSSPIIHPIKNAPLRGAFFMGWIMGLERALEGIHFTAYIIFVHCELLSYAIFVLTISCFLLFSQFIISKCKIYLTDRVTESIYTT